MSLGAILVGIAVALIVIGYVAQPFRHTTTDPDTIIETWVAKLLTAPPSPSPPPTPPYCLTSPPSHTDTQVNFCPQCGCQVAPDHRFCPGCGARLPREEGAA